MQRCYGCMQEFEKEYELCPHCGFIVGTPTEMVNHLPYGTRLQDRYIIGKALGHGGFGITYIAWDDEEQSVVAIKEFFPHSLSMRNPGEKKVYCYVSDSSRYYKDGIKKMMDEGRKLSRFIENENIVDVYDFFEENNTAYIVMEYLEGRDLKKYLEEVGGRLEPQAAIRIMLPVLNALADMHSDNLIHRDIAPDNIFICDDGRIKLLDFGSARLAVQDADRSLSVLIKPGYAPKEQYLSRSKQGPWTDVYAACATLYRIVTGEIPVPSTERDTVPLKPFSKFGLRGHEALEDVILRGLEPEIEDRIKYAQLLEKELKAVFKSYSGDFSELNKNIKRAEALRRRKEALKNKKLLTIIIGAVAAVVAVTAGIVLAIGGSDKKDNDVSKPEPSQHVHVFNEDVAGNEEVTQEVMDSSDTVIVRIGKLSRTQLISSVFSESEKIYMIDVNSDGKSEIVTYTDGKLNIYSNLSDGSLKRLTVGASENSRIYYDKADKTIAFVDSDSGEGKAYRLNDETFEINESVDSGEIASMTEEGILIGAEELISSGDCGEGNRWTYFKEESLLYLTGTLENFKYPAEDVIDTPWSKYRQEVSSVILSDEATVVPDHLCYICGALSEVQLGKSVQKIGTNAFESCDSLKKITLPPTVTEIGTLAFSKSAITEISIGAAVTAIGEDAFFECKSLEKIFVDSSNTNYASDSDGVLYSNDYRNLITYPAGSKAVQYNMIESTENVEKNAFAGCENITHIYFSDRVKTVGAAAFKGCSALELAELPNSLEVISESMFENCGNLLYVDASGRVTDIETLAFANCTKLETVKLSSSLKNIGKQAFLNCTGAEKITVPSSVKYVGANAFEGWTSSQTIEIDNSKRNISDWHSGWQKSCKAEVTFTRII